jgi:hypothetical protein
MRRFVVVLTVLWATQARAELIRWPGSYHPDVQVCRGRISVRMPWSLRVPEPFFVRAIVGDGPDRTT